MAEDWEDAGIGVGVRHLVNGLEDEDWVEVVEVVD